MMTSRHIVFAFVLAVTAHVVAEWVIRNYLPRPAPRMLTFPTAS
jgi:uncharacterized membrane protein YhdT